MNKSILITGIAGSGKSAICGELNRLGYKAHDIEDIKDLFKMINKKTGKGAHNYDNSNLESVKNHEWICDKKKLQQLINNNSKGIVFYCGVASNLNDMFPLFDKIFLLKVGPKILCKRLSTRTSNDFGRTPEVQKDLLIWKKDWEDYVCKKGAVIINANQNLQNVANDIIKKSYLKLKFYFL